MLNYDVLYTAVEVDAAIKYRDGRINEEDLSQAFSLIAEGYCHDMEPTTTANE